MVLRIDPEIDIRSEAHAECVGRHFHTFDDRCAASIEEHDLKRRQHIGIGEQIPGGARCTLVIRIRQVWRRDDAILVAVWVVDRNLGRRTLRIDHQLGRAHQELRFGFQFDRHHQVLWADVDRLLILGLVSGASLLLAEGGLSHRQAVRAKPGVGALQKVGVRRREESAVFEQQREEQIVDRFGPTASQRRYWLIELKLQCGRWMGVMEKPLRMMTSELTNQTSFRLPA